MTRNDTKDTDMNVTKDTTEKHTAEAVKETGREALAAAKSGISEAASAAKSAIRDEAEIRAEAGKDMIAGRGQRLARDLREAAGSQGTDTFQGRLLDTVASGVSDLSEGLRGRTLSSILEQGETFARRNPGAFVAGAAIAGFALARFALASDQSRESDGDAANIAPASQSNVSAAHAEKEFPS